MASFLPLFLIVLIAPLSAGEILGSSVPSVVPALGQPKPSKGIARAFLEAHNHLRATFDEPPLRWDKKLARFARRWAFRMRSDCNLTHSQGPYGENIFIGLGAYTIAEAMEEWAKERWHYHWANNTCNPNEMCGHFTQMIWNETQSLGCARMKCDNTSFTFFTCNYDPPGNYIGRRPILDYQKHLH